VKNIPLAPFKGGICREPFQRGNLQRAPSKGEFIKQHLQRMNNMVDYYVLPINLYYESFKT
jgi:hypothetical protein